jgi:hypothetical protein
LDYDIIILTRGDEMYCKSCGAPLEENAKFCMSCGTPVEKEKPVEPLNNNDYYDDDPFEEPKQEAPRQFGYNDSLQEGQNADYQRSNFYGKKFEASSSGSIGFGNRTGRGKRGNFLGAAFVIAIVFFAWFIFFGNNAPIYDIEIGAEVNSSTFYPDEPLDYVIESEGTLYISYTTRNLDIGDVIVIEVYDTTIGEWLIYSDSTTNDFEEQIGYFEVYENWTAGSYEIRFLVDGDEVASRDFTVEFE